MISAWSVVLLCICKAYAENYTLPAYFSVCYRDDPNVASCIKEKIETLLPIIKSGSKEFDLDRIDPLDFFNLNFKFKSNFLGGSIMVPKANIRGLSNLKVLDVKPKLNNPEKFALDFDVYLDQMLMTMPYSLDGNVERFSVNMKGNLDLKFDGVNLTYHLEGDVKPKDGHDFLHLTAFRWRFRKNENGIGDFRIVNDDVVFDKPILNALAKTVVRVSWRAIVKAMLPTLLPTIDQNLKHTFTNFFLKYPFDVLFPKTKTENAKVQTTNYKRKLQHTTQQHSN